MHFKHLLDNWQIFLFSLGFAAIGILAILYPDALADFNPIGSRIIYRVILKFIWGRPFGIALLIFGLLGIWVSLLPDRNK